MDQENKMEMEQTEEIEKDAANPEIDPVTVEMNDLKTEIDKISDKYVRLNAEFMNYKKRTEKEKADIYKYANEKLFMELLPVMDNFERAMSTIDESQASKSLVDGLQMIKKSLDEFLAKNDVQAIATEGEHFDPELHHAVMTEELGDKEDGIILQEFQKGYKISEKVIRHSMVKVNKN